MSALTQLFSDIADAIRAKTGSASTIVATDFPTEIGNIPSGTTYDDLTVPSNHSTTNTYYGNGAAYIKQLPKFVVDGTTAYGLLKGFKGLKKVEVEFTQSSNTTCNYIFQGCTSLTDVSFTNSSYIQLLQYAFDGCSSLVTAPAISSSNITRTTNMFANCTSLVNVPQYDTSNIANGYLSMMFSNCPMLSNDSLNNILAMCTAATNYTTSKSLSHLGLTQSQALTCTTLSNYSAFTAAGWTPGYNI